MLIMNRIRRLFAINCTGLYLVVTRDWKVFLARQHTNLSLRYKNGTNAPLSEENLLLSNWTMLNWSMQNQFNRQT